MKDIPIEEINEYGKKYCISCEDKCNGKSKDLYKCLSENKIE